MAVADVFDALVSKRSYKDGFPLEKAYAIIEEGAGTHFDPLIARAFLNARDKAEAVCREYGDGQTDKIRAKARKDSSSRKETPPSPGNKKERT
jgi:putative two-component system response regulator